MVKNNESNIDIDIENKNAINKKDVKLTKRRNIVITNLNVDDGWTELKYKKPTPIKRLADSLQRKFLKIF